MQNRFPVRTIFVLSRSAPKRRSYAGRVVLALLPLSNWLPLLTGLPLLIGLATTAVADDWPMWRHDAQRSAASSNHLPAEFGLLWKRDLSPRQQVWDDPLNHDLMPYDRVFEPIVMGGRLFVGFNDRNKLLAMDAGTGKELWSVFAEAPVRLPPAGWNGRVYFVSDDGFLYCVDAASGDLLWKFNGAPNSQHAIGNGRITSAWPARGGPVIRDDTVYFAASIWPFMGTFVYAIDAESGEVRWVNDSTGAQYIKQPHSAPSFAGVAPQGALVATETELLVPGGRSVPAVFNRGDGKLRYFEINAGGKGTGGSFVSADSNHFYVHTRQKGTRAFALQSGVKTAFMPNEPVLSDGLIYSAEIDDDDKPIICAYGADHKRVWEINADGRGDLIAAGDKLVAAGSRAITVIQLPKNDEPARIVHSIPLDGDVQRLVVADGKLFAVTITGQIIAFGNGPPEPKSTTKQIPPVIVFPQETGKTIESLLAAGDAEGYALWFGTADAAGAKAIASLSPFVQLAVVDNDRDAVDRMRRQLDDAQLGGRVTVHHSEASEFRAPSYVANMVFVDHDATALADPAIIPELYKSVRPYGGVMHLVARKDREQIAAGVRAMNLEQAQVEIGKHSVIVRRVGALPGSADWTHQYGDIANTIKSDDRRVKLPLGVLWFGGSSNLDVLPRHGHGPPEQVVGGRLFIQGENRLSARDVYTGRVLWNRDFDDLGTFDVYFDKTYADTPLSTQYNQVHIPGANGRGTNYVVTDDRVYIIDGGICHALDPATGKNLNEFRLPQDDSGDVPNWGYIGVYKNVLIGGLGFAKYGQRHDLSFESDKKLRSSRAGFGTKSLDRAASLALVAFDRHSGEQLWTAKANHSFWHNGIVAGGEKIYCLDKNPQQIEEAMRRRGKSQPASYRIVALDYLSGEVEWEVREGIFGTWLGYSEEHDLLLQAGAKGSDRLYAEAAQGMAVYAGSDGSLRWKNDSLKYAGPCILHNDLIITNANSYTTSAGAFYLQDGTQKMVKNPLTGEMQPWRVTRAYGCNSIIASENLLTFRSGAAGFYDLLSDGGTGNLGGFKSGCTSNLVVANGVLNAPDYTRTCSCAYQNQTSLALVHMPEMDAWSVDTAGAIAAHGKSIQQLGINFGAPGDRRDSNGVLWIEYPIVAGPYPPVSINLNSEARFFQHHSSTMAAADRPWVSASGVNGVSDIRIGIRLQNEPGMGVGIPISHASDDAEEDENGSVSLGSSDLELVDDGGSQWVGMRFNNIKLDPGSVVRSAYIQFTCDEVSSDKTSLIITAQDSGNAQRFSSSSHDLSSRTRTAKEVGWIPAAWSKVGAASEDQRSPNLASLVQSVIDRPDWKSGNSLALLINGVGKRVAASFKGGAGKAPRLVIDAQQVTPARVSATQPATRYDVKLFFAAPAQEISAKSVFDVHAQGELVIKDVTLDPPGSGSKTSVTHLLKNVPIVDELHLRFVPKQGSAIVSGIEIRQHAGD